jgi:hypothetical protein
MKKKTAKNVLDIIARVDAMAKTAEKLGMEYDQFIAFLMEVKACKETRKAFHAIKVK